MNKVLITGGRKFNEPRLIRKALQHLPKDSIICHGGAKGADLLADRIAKKMGFKVLAYPVDHKLDGPWPIAGPNRNSRMLKDFKPTMAMAFPDPDSKGTWDMVRKLRKAGIEPLIFYGYEFKVSSDGK